MFKTYLRNLHIYKKIARIYWDILHEKREWKLYVLCSIPGEVGVKLRAKFLVKYFGAYGKHPYIREGFRVDNPHKLVIGNYFRCNRDLYISAGGGVEIGDYVLIGPSCKIWSINHKYDRLDIPIYKQGWDKELVIIEDGVWIAANVFIAPGVTIGKGSVIFAGAVVVKSVRPYAIVAGNPGRIIGSRSCSEEYIENRER